MNIKKKSTPGFKKKTASGFKKKSQTKPGKAYRSTTMPQTNSEKFRSSTTLDLAGMQSSQSETLAEKMEVKVTKISLLLPKINISLCDFYEHRKREELLNLTFKNLNFEVQSSQEFLTLKMRMNKI